MGKNVYISIITVNFNGLKDTEEFIDSLYRHVIVPFELIIVDNGSRENEALIIEKRYPNAICIRSEKNLGFSGGNNLGIKHAKGKYLYFLNNDLLVTDNSLVELALFLEKNQNIGGVSPMIKSSYSIDQVQYAGYTALSNITMRNTTIGLGDKDKGQYNKPMVTAYLHGAAMVVRRNIIDKIGYMPEAYFLYYEEVDWSTQITDYGYELWCIPGCKVLHKESQSVGQESYTKVFYMTRNRLLYTWRHRRGITKYLSILYLSFIVLVKKAFAYSLKYRFDLLLPLFRGHIAFFKMKDKKTIL